MIVDPNEISVSELHGHLLGAVAPRPIAFASTVDKAGNVNLSPFSFFNCFSANPPILIFSPANRGRDNTTKHTHENVLEVSEVGISVVNYDIVEQMSLSSMEYDKGVNEFVKAGLTPVDSLKITPPRVAESPVSFECKVIEVKSLGDKGGAGNLVICEVVLIHVSEQVLDDNGRIDPFKLDAVARMGGSWYCRAQGDSIFEIPKPVRSKGIGVDQIPENIRNSNVLTGNNLGRLGNIEQLPDDETILNFKDERLSQILSGDQIEHNLHCYAQECLEENQIEKAWILLLQPIK